MTVATTIATLADLMKTVTVPGAMAKVYSAPQEATAISEFPCFVWALAPDSDHTVTMEAAGDPGLDRHNYTLSGYLFVGRRDTPLPELHGRILRWFEPQAGTIWRVLRTDITLGDTVEFIGDPDAQLFRYRIGPIDWAGGKFWGARLWLPVTEKHQTS